MLTLLHPDYLDFPEVEKADEYGLLAIGGDLSRDRLLHAYKSGIFPWYSEDEPICWWSPDPRSVLLPQNLKISKSMRPVMSSSRYRFTTNRDFEGVIKSCKKTPRKTQEGTWINDEIVQAYIDLHKVGYAHSAEAWQDGSLVGGLYGVKIGKVFFGESMFSKATNASKFAFISMVRQMQQEGIKLIDCQVHSEHLESLGASVIPRIEFINLLQQLTDES